jgi:hypothetical protein
MHAEILSQEQKDLMPFIQSFQKEYYLVGGTAIALQIGHRVSVDFDLFKKGNIQPSKISKRFQEFGLTYQLLFQDANGIHFLCNEVKITFFQFPFNVPSKLAFNGVKMPDLLHLAAMKAYALGRRAKWKDYVDLCFILKNYHTIEAVSSKSQELFGNLFSPKLFMQQLCYFEDVNYSEEVEYLGETISDDDIKNFLSNISTKNF